MLACHTHASSPPPPPHIVAIPPVCAGMSLPFDLYVFPCVFRCPCPPSHMRHSLSRTCVILYPAHASFSIPHLVRDLGMSVCALAFLSPLSPPLSPLPSPLTVSTLLPAPSFLLPPPRAQQRGVVGIYPSSQRQAGLSSSAISMRQAKQTLRHATRPAPSLAHTESGG
jgi:hypothetical protein